MATDKKLTIGLTGDVMLGRIADEDEGGKIVLRPASLQAVKHR